MSIEINGWVTGPVVFEAVPKSAETIAAVIGAAASIESDWVSVLAILTHAEVDAAVALWQSLRGAQAQGRAILEIARLKLDAAEFELLKMVLRRLESHRKLRDRFAHGVWARTLGRDDQLVLLTGRTLAAFSARMFAGGDIFDLTLTIEERDIFGAAQLREALNEAERARGAMSSLVAYLWVSKALAPGDHHGSLDRTRDEINRIWQ